MIGPEGRVPGLFVERPLLALFEAGPGVPPDDGVVLARLHRAADVLAADGSIRRHVRRSGHGDR